MNKLLQFSNLFGVASILAISTVCLPFQNGAIEEITDKLESPNDIFSNLSVVTMVTQEIDSKNRLSVRIQCVKVKHISVGERLELLSEYLDSPNQIPASLPYITLYNEVYNAGMNEVDSKPGSFFLSNVIPHDSDSESEQRHQFSFMFYALGQDILFSELGRRPDITLDEVSIDGNEGLVTFQTEAGDKYKVVFDLKRGICVRQERVTSDPETIYSVSCQFESEDSKIPSTVTLDVDQIEWETKRKTTTTVLSIEPAEGLTKEMIFLTHYGIPEPAFATSEKKNGLWRMGMGLALAVVAGLLIFVSRRKSAK